MTYYSMVGGGQDLSVSGVKSPQKLTDEDLEAIIGIWIER